MKGLLGMLKPALAIVDSPARVRLRDAITARDVAIKALEDARSLVARIESVIDAAQDATRHATDADVAAKTALAAWAQSGCDPQGVAEGEKLATAADEAKRIADRAQVAAEAARKGLGQAQGAVSRAQSSLQEYENKIRYAIDLIFVDEFAPTLERLERLAAEYQACRVQARGLHDFVGSAEAGRIIREAYGRASETVKPIPDYECTPAGTPISAPPAEVLKLTAAWRERASALKMNPDA